MNVATARRAVLGVCAAAAWLEACGGSQSPIGAPGAMPQNRAPAARGDSSSYKVLHSFLRNNSDGEDPVASLIEAGGTLYGTTSFGGTYRLGTVFSITRDGTEKVLHSFGNGDDGAGPVASLIEVKGKLYGTTSFGGIHQYGTVFSITPSGAEKVLHSFLVGSDGADPAASLIEVKGTLYGTTTAGGKYNGSYYEGCGYMGCGTVFSITPSGKERVLHSFGNGDDGAVPFASLIQVKGKLYGTTSLGGLHGDGTVFSMTPSGAETILHSFAGSLGNDGDAPVASLVEAMGKLYGTTKYGGPYSRGCPHNSNDCGTVFSITPSGSEKVLHSFTNGTDGAEPLASLIVVKSELYGTTAYGGAYYRKAYSGKVFSMTLSGSEKVLHSFGNGTDGNFPAARLTHLGGTLYGTTEYGGDSGCQIPAGCGTVFEVTP